MKLILYEDSKVIHVVEQVNNPKVEDKKVSWEGGSLNGISLPFILVSDDAVVGEDVTELLALDQKETYKHLSLEEENAALKSRLEAVEMATLSLMDFM